LYEIIISNQIHYLEIHNTSDGIKTFNAGTRYDFYCLEKTKRYKDTLIIDENGDKYLCDLSNWRFLPNKNFDIFSYNLNLNKHYFH